MLRRFTLPFSSSVSSSSSLVRLATLGSIRLASSSSSSCSTTAPKKQKPPAKEKVDRGRYNKFEYNWLSHRHFLVGGDAKKAICIDKNTQERCLKFQEELQRVLDLSQRNSMFMRSDRDPAIHSEMMRKQLYETKQLEEGGGGGGKEEELSKTTAAQQRKKKEGEENSEERQNIEIQKQREQEVETEHNPASVYGGLLFRVAQDLHHARSNPEEIEKIKKLAQLHGIAETDTVARCVLCGQPARVHFTRKEEEEYKELLGMYGGVPRLLARFYHFVVAVAVSSFFLVIFVPWTIMIFGMMIPLAFLFFAIHHRNTAFNLILTCCFIYFCMTQIWNATARGEKQAQEELQKKTLRPLGTAAGSGEREQKKE